MRKIYLASSWRNQNQPLAVQMLRNAGHEVYDFRNPAPGNTGFSWSEIDTDWLDWTPQRFIEGLSSPIAVDGFSHDKAALDWCDTCILLLPCGRSAHLEAGYAIGKGKPTLIVLDNERFEPELMYLLADKIVHDLSRMLPALSSLGEKHEREWRAECKKCGRKWVNWYAFGYCDCGEKLEGAFYEITENE